MRKSHLVLLAALLGASLGMAPAAPATDEAANSLASKTGVCVHIPRLQEDPLCVLVDPDE